MRKFLGKRGFAVFTSLALCASLVAPSFAATFSDLQKAVDGGNGTYGVNNDITREGDTITLNGTVERTDADTEPITIGSGKDIVLNLNGNTIDGIPNSSNKAVIWVNGGSLTIQDSESGGGQIKGGNSNGAVNLASGQLTLNGGTISDNANGTGVKVGNGTTFTMKGGTISGNTAGNGGGVQVNGGTFTMSGGVIKDNEATSQFGGGVYVSGGTFEMNGGEISNNTTKASGGGVGVNGSNASFTMNAGTISGNTASNSAGEGGGGGVYVKDDAQFTMNDGMITGNETMGANGNGGGVAVHQANFTMKDGTISENTAANGGGVYVNGGGQGLGEGAFTMNGGTIKGNALSDAVPEGSGKRPTDVYVQQQGEDSSFVMNGEDARVNGLIFVSKDGQITASKGASDEDQGEYDGVKEIEEGNLVVKGDTVRVKEDVYLRVDFTKPNSPNNPTGPFEEDKDPTDDEEQNKDPDEVEIEEPDVPLGGLPDFDDEVEIDEPDVPLAGLFTRADAIGYLWEQAGSPDAALSDFPDVPADHEWAVAIGWAQDMGIALPDLEGNFRPDDLLERSVADIALKPEGELEQFLNRYAVYAGIELEPGELFIELSGEPDDIIMGEDAQIIFDDFFVRLELALAQSA